MSGAEFPTDEWSILQPAKSVRLRFRRPCETLQADCWFRVISDWRRCSWNYFDLPHARLCGPMLAQLSENCFQLQITALAISRKLLGSSRALKRDSPPCTRTTFSPSASPQRNFHRNAGRTTGRSSLRANRSNKVISHSKCCG